jgi:hypothetical protein
VLWMGFAVRRCAAENGPVIITDRGWPAHVLIAATALVYGLTVVMRNVADFEPMGVSVLNPWAPQS